MNSQTSMPSTSNQRLILSGKLKRPSKQITTLNSNLNPLINKKPFLKEYSNAMQQKLQSLKQKISQKKKQKTKQENSNILQKTQSSKLESFLKNKNTKKQQKIKNKILVKQQTNLSKESQQQNLKIFEQFLQKNNLISYKNLLIQHQIDTLDILADATQKQLQQIGIPKGHCLKLKVNIAKFLNNDKFLNKSVSNLNDKQRNANSQDKQLMEKKFRQSKTKDSQRNKSFINTQIAENKPQKQIQSISIGTQNEQGMESINLSQPSKSKFCLFCYQSIKKNMKSHQQDMKQFCSQTCLQKYNQMFKKYQNNLFKVQQEFKKSKNQKLPESQKQKEQKQEFNQQGQNQNEWIDFLQDDQNEVDNFDFDEYNLLKRQLE